MEARVYKDSFDSPPLTPHFLIPLPILFYLSHKLCEDPGERRIYARSKFFYSNVQHRQYINVTSNKDKKNQKKNEKIIQHI